MARKRLSRFWILDFSKIKHRQSVRRNSKGFRRWMMYPLLALITLLLCVGSPVWATAPAPKATLEQRAQRQSDPSQLVEQGRSLYEAGQYTQAVELLQQAVSAYESQGDSLRQAMTLSNLALAYQELGQWEPAKTAIATSLELIQVNATEPNSGRSQLLAQTLDIQGRLQLATGQSEQALETWQQSAAIYTQLQDQSSLTRNQINQAQALQSLGLYRRALSTLAELRQTLEAQSDSSTKMVGLRSLGDALQRVGDLPQAQEVLQQSLAIAQRLESATDISAALVSLGNVARSQRGETAADSALSFYQQAAATAPSLTLQAQAQLNQLSLLLEQRRWAEAQALWPQIQPQLSQLPPSRAAVYAQVNFAESLRKLSEATGQGSGRGGAGADLRETAQVLATAAQQARQLGDQRAESYALGNLAELYEQAEQWPDAQSLTQQALLLSQTINAADISYRWQWQLGRILKAQGDETGAIAAYTAAVNTLQALRSDLVAVNPDVQFSFRESVEPVYRQLVSLLLETDSGTADTQDNLAKARTVIESLQQAELENFFREACLNGTPVQIDQVDTEAAVVYPIILPDRLEVVFSLPGQPLSHHATALPQERVEAVLDQLRQAIAPGGSSSNRGQETNDSTLSTPESLEESGTNTETLNTTDSRDTPAANTATPDAIDEAVPDATRGGVQPVYRQPQNLSTSSFLTLSQQVYDWLIEPIEADLATSEIKTLVFVLDSAFLNVPMAVLHDGQQYLIEKYAIALTPGLQLLDPKPLARRSLKTLTAGLTEAREDFPALPFVALELEQIKSEVPTSEILLNESFTSRTLENQVNAEPFRVVHLATHGQFSSDIDKTFILTWDGKIDVSQLNTLLRTRDETRSTPIELLVLSACETATGDKRAALGLAGVAIRAGARSTLASLWQIDDRSTALLIGDFYQELTDTTITKAEALRRAQVKLLQQPEYSHPNYWAAYVLVGNWL